MYLKRNIDAALKGWAENPDRKPLMIRGARQVGKSTAVRNLGKHFENYIEINFERNPEYAALFKLNLDIKRIVSQIGALSGKILIPGQTLLFLDEIQACPEAVMALRFFHEELPELHVVAAGSLLEFALEDVPTFGVGRIHSMFMYPMTFDEFLEGCGEINLKSARDEAIASCSPLAQPLHARLVELLRVFMIVGGMPEVVRLWIESHDFVKCQMAQDDIIIGYEADFAKYRKKVDSHLLQATLRSCALQVGHKFVYSEVSGNYKSAKINEALGLLTKAGLIIQVVHTAANGIPLGSEVNMSYRKIVLLDVGLFLRLLNISMGDATQLTSMILTSSSAELVNKGQTAEMLAGLEMLYNSSANIRHDLYYWQRQAKNSLAEIDYVTVRDAKIVPIEVKAGQQGGMKSLWLFMKLRDIHEGIRISLENLGRIENRDLSTDTTKEVVICPLYAVSQLNTIYNNFASKV